MKTEMLEAAYLRAVMLLLNLNKDKLNSLEFTNHALVAHSLLNKPWADSVIADVRRVIAGMKEPS
jgi:hypothetical protein